MLEVRSPSALGREAARSDVKANAAVLGVENCQGRRSTLGGGPASSRKRPSPPLSCRARSCRLEDAIILWRRQHWLRGLSARLWLSCDVAVAAPQVWNGGGGVGAALA
eukprot:3928033-Pyramimonas_sp.AAC.1